MSDSPDLSVHLISSTGGYSLLQKYKKEAKILSIAYSYSEAKYREIHKYLTYPVIILSAVASVCAGLDINQYALMGLSLSILILSGFNTAINPKDREHKANQVKTEFGEISSAVSQFILENNKSKEDIRSQSQLTHELLNVWKGMSPPIADKFIKRATLECTKRLRTTSQQDKKNVAQSPSLKKIEDLTLNVDF